MLYDEIMKIVTLAGEDGIERKNNSRTGDKNGRKI